MRRRAPFAATCCAIILSGCAAATTDGKAQPDQNVTPPLPEACLDRRAPTPPAPLRTFYVDGDLGDDGAAGTSPSTAWRTLGRANSGAQPGDEFVLSGTFSGEYIRPNQSGTATNKIVYRAAAGAAPKIDGGAFEVILWLDDLSHVVIDGIEVTNDNYMVQLFRAQNNWLRNLHIHGGGAIHLSGASDNRIEDCAIENVGSEASNAGEDIFLQDGSHRNVIVRNTLGLAGHGNLTVGGFQNAAEATCDDNVVAQNDMTNPWASGLLLNGKAVRTLVECNRVHGTADGSGVNYPRSCVQVMGTDNVLRFNEIFACGASGITLEAYPYSSFTQNALNNHLFGNTIWQTGGEGMRFLVSGPADAQGNLLENNIVWAAAGFPWDNTRFAMTADVYNATNPWPVGSMNGNLMRNNDFPSGQSLMLVIRNAPSDDEYTLGETQATFTGWEENLQVDPSFVDQAAGDVRLQAGSPCIDVGRGISGVAYLGTRPDLGAHERQ